jgi:predicted TIM-barrel fold metal-dependent hydrolase
MATATDEAPRPIIDTCIHHRWPSFGELWEYLGPSWRNYVGPGQNERLFPLFAYPNPAGDHLASAASADGRAAGSDPAQLEAQVLGPNRVERALLVHGLDAMMAPVISSPFLGRELARAINDWSIDRWLESDDRLYGAVLVATQTPLDAAAEIRRVGAHPKMAAVVVMSLGTGKLLGHPLNDPIFEAAEEVGLPVIVHRGGDAIPDTPAAPAGGQPLTFAEYATVAPLAVINQVFNLITMGTLSRYAGTKIFIEGAGVSWMAGLVRRMDLTWKAMRKEVPWVTEPPSRYFERHFRVGTYGLERHAGAEMVARIAELRPDFADLVCYGSGYPAWDTVSPQAVAATLPPDWQDRVLRENAERWFRWASGRADPAMTATTT